jgi:coenzyme F420-reducing hydrogenase alpha subunit
MPEAGSNRKPKSRTIAVDYLARVEGEGNMYVRIKGDKVEKVQFGIFEPPRFFEAFLRGRRMNEAVDITARICGICPIAYQMSAAHAMERACGVLVDGPIRELRRLLYCGEWIESHVLHAFMLHAPDFLGYESALEMAQDHGDLVRNVLEVKKIGNDIVNLLGGREIHPINVRVGGFYRVPTRHEWEPMIERLEWGRDFMVEATKIVGGLEFPDFEREYEMVSLVHPDEYPFNEGRLQSTAGLDIDIGDYYDHIEESHVDRSNALHSHMKKRGAYFVGPMARYNLNFERLSPLAKEAAREGRLGKQVWNPFKSIVVRCVETVYAFDEALRILAHDPNPDKPFVEVKPAAGTGHGCTEAPRGILYHRYRLDDEGIILSANICPPTAQNQPVIEQDLYEYVDRYKSLPDDELKWRLEQAIRNYDPCISCSVHFLNLTVERE